MEGCRVQERLMELPDGDGDSQQQNSPKRRCGGKRFVELPAREQRQLMPASLEEMVEPDDPVRAVAEVMAAVDMSRFEEAYRGGGRPAYPPRVVCSVLVYAYMLGITSARQIAVALKTDVRMMYLAHGLRIDHRTLSLFRRRHAEALEDLFRQVVRIGIKVGVVRMSHVGIDGTKIAARAGRRVYGAEELEGMMERIKEEIRQYMEESRRVDEQEDERYGESSGYQLPEELRDRQRLREKIAEAKEELEEGEQKAVSVSEPEARVQKIGREKRPGYNCQVAVDIDSGMIVSQAVVVDQSDNGRLGEMMECIERDSGQAAEVVTADGGYESKESIEAAERWAARVEVYIGRGSGGRRTEGWGREKFGYDERRDQWVCPAGRVLVRMGDKELGGKRYAYYRAQVSCRDCRHTKQCMGGTKKSRYRGLLVSGHGREVEKMRTKAASEAGREAMKRHWGTVERVIGQIKCVLGLRRFRLWGLAGAKVEFTLACIAANIRQMAGWLMGDGSVKLAEGMG